MKQIFDNNDYTKKLWLNGIIDFNNSFIDSFNMKEIIDKYKNEEWFENNFELLKNDYSIDERNLIDIKNTYEYKFILKLLKEEDLLTKEFIKYLEEK